MNDQPDHAAQIAALRAERDELEQRAVEAETIAEQLADALADAQRRLVESGATAADTANDNDTHTDTHLTLFDGASPTEPGSHFAPDGSDEAVLPIALAATAVVAFLVALVTVASGGVGLITLLALVVAAVLAWAAYQTRVVRVSVEIIDSVVEIVQGDATRTFDLSNDSIKVDVQGNPGDDYWRVRFYRRALDPVDVDSTMVDAESFMSQLRELRPGL